MDSVEERFLPVGDSKEKREPATEEESRGNCLVHGTKAFLQTSTTKLSKGSRWIWKDLRQGHLVWLKLIFFFQSASMVVLYPYLVLHMRSLGLNVEEVALVNTVVPAADILGPALAGFIADKIGNFRVFMSGLTAVGGAASILILLVPKKIVGEPYCCTQDTGQLLCTPTAHNYSVPTVGFLNCGNGTAEYNVSTAIFREQLDFCDTSCSLARSEESSGLEWSTVLCIYIALRATLDILRASSLMMFEGAVVVTIKQLGGDYGLQKLFGTFGAIIWGPISGVIIDYASRGGVEDYAPVFYLYCAMRLVCALLILKLDLKFKQPAKKVFKDVGKLIIRPHITIFLVMFFICGSIWGLIEAYFFWFLQDLGSTKLTMGISLAVGTVAGIPLTIASGAIIKYFGQVNVIVGALVIYSLRLFGYSCIQTPAAALFFELLKPFGNSLLMIAAMTYAKDNASISTMASLEGVMGALYFGVGKAVGGLLGGLSIDAVGERTTFRIFSGVCMVSALIYLTFNILYARRKARREPEVEGRRDHNDEADAPPAADHSEELDKEGQDDENDTHETSIQRSTRYTNYDKEVQPTKTDKDDIEPSLSETRT